MIWFNRLLVLTTLVGSVASADCTDGYAKKPYWIALGLGISPDGFSIGGGYSRAIIGGVGTLRLGAIVAPSTVDPAQNSFRSELESSTMLGVLFGPSFENHQMHLTMAIGPAWTWGTTQRHEGLGSLEEDFSLPSIALDVQTFITAYRALGFGLIGFGNINDEESYFGILACIQLR